MPGHHRAMDAPNKGCISSEPEFRGGLSLSRNDGLWPPFRGHRSRPATSTPHLKAPPSRLTRHSLTLLRLQIRLPGQILAANPFSATLPCASSASASLHSPLGACVPSGSKRSTSCADESSPFALLRIHLLPDALPFGSTSDQCFPDRLIPPGESFREPWNCSEFAPGDGIRQRKRWCFAGVSTGFWGHCFQAVNLAVM